MEYFEGCDLESYYNNCKAKNKLINEQLLWEFSFQILCGLVYLHEEKKFIHRDIKPDNLLIDKNFRIKITDFGISAINSANVERALQFNGTIIGPKPYMAPEVYTKIYDFKVDVYMLGLTLFYLMTGNLPDKIPVLEGNTLTFDIDEKSFNRIPNYYSIDLKNFVKKLLIYNKYQRPSSNLAYEEALLYYTYKYLGITSFACTLECLFAVPKLSDYFRSENIKNLVKNDYVELNNSKFLYTKIIKEAFDYVNPNNFYFPKIQEYCTKLRTRLYSKTDEKKRAYEIELESIIPDIIKHLHSELKNIGFINIPFHNIGNNMSNQIDDGNKISEHEQGIKPSKISEQFFYLLKTTFSCLDCNKKTSSFDYHLSFALYPERAAIRLNKINIDMKDLFAHAEKDRLCIKLNHFCKFCGQYKNKMYISSCFYIAPINLILWMDYTDGNKFNLKIEEYIDLSNFVDKKDIINFRLIGAIFTDKKDDNTIKYVSYTKDTQGQWIYFNGTILTYSNINELRNHKGIKYLFYTSL